MSEHTDEILDALAPGEKVGEYTIVRKLGQGAMAEVYLATQEEREVALKVLPARFAGDAEYQRHFFREFEIAHEVKQCGILCAYDKGATESGLPYFTMDYINGRPLGQMLKEQGVLSLRQTMKYALQLAFSMNLAWKKHQFIHGDIKPENIVIQNDDQAVLIDFGLARIHYEPLPEEQVMLTPLYAAPELIRGWNQESDCRTDIYAFGTTLYHLLNGAPPLDAQDASVVLNRQKHENAVPLHYLHPEVPVPLSELIQRMIQKVPQNRPQEWQTVLIFLRNFYVRTWGHAAVEEVLAPLAARARKLAATDDKKVPKRKEKSAQRATNKRTNLLLFIFGVALALVLGTLLSLLFLRKNAGPRPEEKSPPQKMPAVEQKTEEKQQDASPIAKAQPAAEKEKTSEYPAGDLKKKSPLKATETGKKNVLREKGIPFVMPRDVREARLWISAIRVLLQVPYRLNEATPVEPLMKAVAKWRRDAQVLWQKYDAKKPEERIPWSGCQAGQFMDFMEKTILPSLDLAKPLLCRPENLKHLEGVSFTLTGGQEARLLDLNETQGRIRVSTGARREVRIITWQEMQRCGMLEKVCAHFLEMEISQNMRRSLLALQAFTGHSRYIHANLEKLPYGEREFWQALASMNRYANRSNVKVLPLWDALQAACRSGNALQARKQAQKLLHEKEAPLVSSNLPLLQQIMEKTEKSDPSVAAGRLARGAMAMLAEGRGEEAMQEALYVKSRFDKVKYPEKSELNHLIQRAAVLRGQAGIAPIHDSKELLPFWTMRGPGVASAQAAQFAGFAGNKEQQELYRKLARFEWGVPYHGEKTLREVRKALSSTEDISFLEKSVGFLNTLYWNGNLNWTRTPICSYREALLIAMAAWLRDTPSIFPDESMLDWQRQESALRTFRYLREAVMPQAKGAIPLPPANEPPEVQWAQLAAWYAKIEGTPGHLEKCWPELRQRIEQQGGRWPVPAGKLIYQMVVALHSTAQTRGDAAAAKAYVEWALNLRAPCLYCYHGKLVAL